MKASISRTGEWNSVRKITNNLGYKIKHSFQLAANSQARATQKNIVSGIQSQSYGHAPLSASTKEYKARKGLDSRILIATGTYIKSIEVWRDDENTWCVGVKKGTRHPSNGEDVGQIGLWLEYGTSNMPARPHWRVESNKLKARIKKKVTEELRKNIL